jgi:hypothetical protein
MNFAARTSSIVVIALALGCGSNGSDDSTNMPDSGLDSSMTMDQYVSKDATTTKDSTSGDASVGCGTCPTGYTCGTANGIAVCRATTTSIPLFSHVFVILMENTSLSTLQAAITANTAPTLKMLQSTYASASNYHGVAHPSLPNYIALTSGDTQGIGCDCKAQKNQGSCNLVTCNLVLGSCSCDNNAMHIGDQLEAAIPPKTWMDFGEDMGTACNLVDNGNYAVRHNPFLYYDDVQTVSTRCNAHVVDFTKLDLSAPADFTFIAPNLIDDMHNPDPTDSTNIPDGDSWLGTHVSAIMASSGYKNGGLLVVVWDEDDGSGGINGTDVPVGIFVMSPYAKSAGYSSPTKANHYSLLATFEDGLGVGRLGMAVKAAPLSDFFPTN